MGKRRAQLYPDTPLAAGWIFRVSWREQIGIESIDADSAPLYECSTWNNFGGDWPKEHVKQSLLDLLWLERVRFAGNLG
jgi:hypothetical protein